MFEIQPTGSGSTQHETPDRGYWKNVAGQIAGPVLENFAARSVHARMPLECIEGSDRHLFTHLEALGRLLAGLAPWIEIGDAGHFAGLARESIDAATDATSPDFCNFVTGHQPLVDAAFLAQALLRAPGELLEKLPSRVRENLIAALRSTRCICPNPSNWLLFSATIEAALYRMGAADWDRMRIDYAVRQFEQWYYGDSIYGDGPALHCDYYNSLVIHPMLVDVLRTVEGEGEWDKFLPGVMTRARRQAAVLERMISPEGTFPPIGRSLAYRFGALHALAQMALLHQLPPELSPAQVRGAMTAVIRRCMEAPGTFDGEGWLRIGFCGTQPPIGETYISTGSLYLCATGLLPLGLPKEDQFWSTPAEPWTAVKAWSGMLFPIDRAIDS